MRHVYFPLGDNDDDATLESSSFPCHPSLPLNEYMRLRVLCVYQSCLSRGMSVVSLVQNAKIVAVLGGNAMILVRRESE